MGRGTSDVRTRCRRSLTTIGTLLCLATLPFPQFSIADSPRELHDFDVVIAGGSTAAFAAALAAAGSGARTALVEPTDWVGGQLTSSGVPAVDEAWHTVRGKSPQDASLDVARIARDPANITPNFARPSQRLTNPALAGSAASASVPIVFAHANCCHFSSRPVSGSPCFSIPSSSVST